MSVKVSDEVLLASWNAYVNAGMNYRAAALSQGLPESTLKQRVRIAQARNLGEPESVDRLKSDIRRMRDEIKKLKESELNHTIIKNRIIQLTHNVTESKTPIWLLPRDESHSKPGVPTLFLSDLHWAEVVDGKQINNVNRYNLDIAHERIHRLGNRTLRLCEILSPNGEYPGLVLLLGGDMFSGNIHDELTATNEVNSMPAVLDLFDVLSGLIILLRKHFKSLFIPCVTGNHGRDTKKIWSKDRHHTSFDWLLYCFLAKRFSNDPNITFLIPDGSDAYYNIYNHSYLLTHGDQFRGGDGVIGPLGPIIRGDHRKRSRNMQINMSYDTMVMGHWHQYLQLERLIVNGSLKGYDEYAWSGNFPFEPPQQALWMTHPKYGITFRAPVKVDVHKETKARPWVSVAA